MYEKTATSLIWESTQSRPVHVPGTTTIADSTVDDDLKLFLTTTMRGTSSEHVFEQAKGLFQGRVEGPDPHILEFVRGADGAGLLLADLKKAVATLIRSDPIVHVRLVTAAAASTTGLAHAPLPACCQLTFL